MIFDTIANPSPTPLGFVVKNGLKILSRCSAVIPEPLSITAISTNPSTGRVFTVIELPAGLASAAFRNRL